jgi:DNA replication licensing factor MCM6
MPRCIDVICRNEIVEQAKAGDKIVFTGSIAVIPDTSGLSRVGTYIYVYNMYVFIYN